MKIKLMPISVVIFCLFACHTNKNISTHLLSVNADKKESIANELNQVVLNSVKEIQDTIPFEITDGNNILFKTVLNRADTLNLYFDTGGTEIVLKHETIKNKTNLLQDNNANYQEENYEPLENLNSLQIGRMSWDSLTIYPVSIGPEEADGHFGWNLFKDKVVELDYDKNLMIIHPTLNTVPQGYVKREIEHINTLICINAKIKVNNNFYENRFLFDTGFQRAILLDKDLRKKNKFPEDLPVIKESKLKNSVGTEFINRVVNIDEFCFGNICTNNIPVQLISTPNPARFETHILGNELLMRYNTIFDFPNNAIYLKPNSLIDLPFSDSKK